MTYSPLGATFGLRSEKFLESFRDYHRYHNKLNLKLQKLNRRLQLTTKDTKKYSAKEKYSKISKEDYNGNRLFGLLVLLHAERNLAFVESLKLQAKQRGKWKKSEKKLLTTRLKRVCQTTAKLLEITEDEDKWHVKVELLVYNKLAVAEYLLSGKHTEKKNSELIAGELSLAFLALEYLNSIKLVSDDVIDMITSNYEYSLRQNSQKLSSKDLRHFINSQPEANLDDPLVKLLIENGYKRKSVDPDEEDDKSSEISWRSYTAQIRDPRVVQLLREAHSVKLTDISSYSNKLIKWEKALEAQKQFIKQSHDEGDYQEGEDDQILLTYLKYSSFFTTIERDNILFQQLWKQWLLSTSSNRIVKFKKLERIVHNLSTYLQEVMELPGVYSDDELMAQLILVKTYYNIYLDSGCLATLYQSSGKYLEALALYVNSLKQLDNAMKSVDVLDLKLPGDILTDAKVQEVREFITTGCQNIVALAEYSKSVQKQSSRYDPSLIERINRNFQIDYSDISLENLFPLRPQIKPVNAKPALFDLAYNYLSFNRVPAAKNQTQPKSTDINKEAPKKKSIFGLFSR
ncbi:signal recognition particle subunit SRP68 Ecym_2143 [Eremothecium cymbalariae DBVPG|uniref:Signal recognition particle subunit SRP68 n=1 Tax=Eremothecium cymbalariae (strain CBS 270.75 / DBVPG 7215 / KCTC 17166 / NRRL Y-17582) TaxID=931890 RepID=G8JNH9_ERECY|nr:Hypothetical protein Ecym_2143 [Eremothecium cymbalariae DBVPG\